MEGVHVGASGGVMWREEVLVVVLCGGRRC